jgi:class 3 adenylate cyclase
MPEERKLVTILFADVTESTALGESLDPEDLRALMARYYEHARRIVSGHGGTLEKFIGDAVMAVFGLPQAHSNDAERALAAALALRDAVAGDVELDGRLVLRLGVNTGSVVATSDLARGDFLVTGDPVNVAARLEQNANHGEILVGQRTASATEASFLFGPARSIGVKGKSQPLRVFPLESQRPTRQFNHPPLIGRTRELAQLTLSRDRMLRERRPQVISIIAPAGTGKTRLLEEFLSHLFEEDAIQIAVARCLPFGQTLSYWPLRGLLDELLGGAASLQAVASAFMSASYSEDDARRLAVVILTAIGVESEGQEGQVERESLFHAWRLLIEALARKAPRIIVFEDLHWASESLLDLVEYVMRSSAQAALLTITTSRPELLDRRPAWGGGRRNFTALALEPLTEHETWTLVSALAVGVAPEARVKIAERSGGNPFFAIELTRVLGDSQDGDSLPDTVQEAVQERLDALAPRERSVLQAAAVAGRVFQPAALHAALSHESAASVAFEVEDALDSLLTRDFIVAEDGGAYAFRHVLIRDITYNTLARAERIRLHLVVAQWLETFAINRLDEFVELIAYHYAQAALLARSSAISTDTPVDTDRAVDYLERAAARAFQAGALIEARSHLESALKLAPSAAHRRLLEEQGDQSGMLSHLAIPAYRKALTLWRAEAQPAAVDGARIIRKLVTHMMRWHGGMSPDDAQQAEMLELRNEARRLAEEAGEEYEQWRLRVADLFWYWWSGESPTAEASTLMAAGWEAADYFEARGDWDAFSEALDGYGTLAFMLGDWTATYSASQRRVAAPALALYERIDAFSTVIWAQSDSGAYSDSITTVHSLLAQRKTGELATAFAPAVFSARQSAFISGSWSEFEGFDAILDEAWEEAERHPQDPRLVRLWQGDTIFALLIALARDERLNAERVSATLSQLVQLEERDTRRDALQRWSEAILHDDPAPLAAALQEVGSSQDELELLPVSGALCCFLSEHGQTLPTDILSLIAGGRALQREDGLRRWFEIAQALSDDNNTRLATAIDEAEAHGLIPHAARMRVVLAQRTSDPSLLERARPTLERLGDKLFLRKLERIALDFIREP